MATEKKVIEDLGKVGAYKVRVVEGRRGPELDVREYLEEGDAKSGYVGFTRKGIVLSYDQALTLVELIEAAVPKPAERSAQG